MVENVWYGYIKEDLVFSVKLHLKDLCDGVAKHTGDQNIWRILFLVMPGLACYNIQVGTGMPKYRRDLNKYLGWRKNQD